MSKIVDDYAKAIVMLNKAVRVSTDNLIEFGNVMSKTDLVKSGKEGKVASNNVKQKLLKQLRKKRRK